MPSAVAVDTLGLDSSSTAIAMGTFGPSSSSLAVVVVDMEIPGSSFVTVAMEHIEVHQRPSIAVATVVVAAAACNILALESFEVTEEIRTPQYFTSEPHPYDTD